MAILRAYGGCNPNAKRSATSATAVQANAIRSKTLKHLQVVIFTHSETSLAEILEDEASAHLICPILEAHVSIDGPLQGLSTYRRDNPVQPTREALSIPEGGAHSCVSWLCTLCFGFLSFQIRPVAGLKSGFICSSAFVYGCTQLLRNPIDSCGTFPLE